LHTVHKYVKDLPQTSLEASMEMDNFNLTLCCIHSEMQTINLDKLIYILKAGFHSWIDFKAFFIFRRKSAY